MLQKIDGAWWDSAPTHHSDPADILEAIEEQTAYLGAFGNQEQHQASINQLYSLFC